ncbi:MAG: hypothetical protein DHS20C11_32460 [Lysobacteraceae bacterium]|nr:MAG: hypothetical protein DHS20C11_32460 [Xanthomonadaceae bacterium]
MSETSDRKADETASDQGAQPPKEQPLPPEVGGRDGPEPTRFGDWEKNGRCIDF